MIALALVDFFAGWNFSSNSSGFQNSLSKWLVPAVAAQKCSSGILHREPSPSSMEKLRTGCFKIENKHVAASRRCADTFEYVTPLDIDNMIARTRTNDALLPGSFVIGLILLIFCVFSSSILSEKRLPFVIGMTFFRGYSVIVLLITDSFHTGHDTARRSYLHHCGMYMRRFQVLRKPFFPHTLRTVHPSCD